MANECNKRRVLLHMPGKQLAEKLCICASLSLSPSIKTEKEHVSDTIFQGRFLNAYGLNSAIESLNAETTIAERPLCH